MEKRFHPDIATIKCYSCQKMGHYANDCVSITVPIKIEAAAMLMMEDDLELKGALDGDTDYDSAV
jgi:hypothetical protein